MNELVMYSRSSSCPFVSLAKRVLDDYHVPYREIYIDQDSERPPARPGLDWISFRADADRRPLRGRPCPTSLKPLWSQETARAELIGAR